MQKFNAYRCCLAPSRFQKYRRKELTYAIRVEGPFGVKVSGLPGEYRRCEDGYLVSDRGYYRAVDREQFEMDYSLYDFEIASRCANLG